MTTPARLSLAGLATVRTAADRWHCPQGPVAAGVTATDGD
jgi:hypothetical protein